MVNDSPERASVEDRVIATLRSRGAFGLRKYKVTMDRRDLRLRDWGEHLQQELLDGAQYAQRVMDSADLLEEALAIMESLAGERDWDCAKQWLKKYDTQFSR